MRASSSTTPISKPFARRLPIGQQSTNREVGLYDDKTTEPKSGTLSGQLLLADKLNWQSVMFAGYGDDRELTDQNQLVKAGRQVFVKLSYAFQR